MSWRRRGSPRSGPAPHEWFGSHEKLASWVTLAPGQLHQRRQAQARPDRRRRHLYQADAGAGRLVRDPGPEPAQARYDRPGPPMGGAKNPAARKKAIVAIAHTLLKIAYAVLKSGRPYQDQARTSTHAATRPDSARPGWSGRSRSSTPAAPLPSRSSPPGSPPQAALTPDPAFCR